jgi:hypothetical protein
VSVEVAGQDYLEEEQAEGIPLSPPFPILLELSVSLSRLFPSTRAREQGCPDRESLYASVCDISRAGGRVSLSTEVSRDLMVERCPR